MEIMHAADVRNLVLGPGPSRESAEWREGSNAAVSLGAIVAFSSEVSEQHRTDALQSLLLAQLAANAKVERHKEPAEWRSSFTRVLENTAWVVTFSQSSQQYLPRTEKFTVQNVIGDTFRSRVSPEELRTLRAGLNSFFMDNSGAGQVIFECQSHAGRAGNFLVCLVTESGGTASVDICQIHFNLPDYFSRTMAVELTKSAKIFTNFMSYIQNDQLYDRLRSPIAEKIESRVTSSIAVM